MDTWRQEHHEDVLIVDRYPVVRFGLVELLRQLDCHRTVQCTNFDEAIGELRNRSVSVSLVILGVHEFDSINGEKLSEIINLCKKGRILVLTESDKPFHATWCLAAGVHGVISAEKSTSAMLYAIRNVMNGQPLVDDKLVGLSPMGNTARYGAFNMLRLFSTREREIADLLIKGYPLHEISNSLNIGYTTAATYKDRILKKARVANIAQFIRLITAVGTN